MKMADLFLAQLEREVPATRHILERVPDDKPDWKPHAKSMPLGYLSMLVAIIPSWIGTMVQQDNLDLGTGNAPSGAMKNAQLLALFDKSVAAARSALSKTTDEHLSKNWQLLVAGKVVDEKARYAMIGDTFGHLAHHRGQLSVYLRLNDIKVPSIYGPTADENWK